MTTIKHLSELNGTPHANVFPESEPKTIRLTLADGEQVDPHTHPGREIVLYLIDGTIQLQIGSETHELEQGDVAQFDGAQEISCLVERKAASGWGRLFTVSWP